MSYKSYYSKGEWQTICDVCGRQYKSSELRLRWDGAMTCSGDWETRQPQDYVHGIADIQAPPWARPESTDSFILNDILFGLQSLFCSSSSSIGIKVIIYNSTKKELNGSTLNIKTVG